MARALTGRQDSSQPIGDGTKAGICVLGARCLIWNEGDRYKGGMRALGAACHGASTMFIGVRSFKDLLGIVIANRRGASPRGLLSGCAALATVASWSPAGRCATRTPTVMGGAGAAAAALETSCPRGCSRSATSGTGPAKRLAAAVGEGPVSVRSPASTSRSLTERIHLH